MNTQVPQPSGSTNNVADEAVHKELGDCLVRIATTASSLEAKQDSARVKSSDKESSGEDASKQERWIDAKDQDEDITPVNVQDDVEMFDVDDLGGEEVFVTKQQVVSTTATTVTIEELSLAQALKALNTSKPKVYMLVEKIYPLIPPTLTMILEKKLQIDYQSEMAYQLLKLIKKQLKKGLHKGYDSFQSLLSQLENHGTCVSTKDANQKFLRSLPSSWSQVSLIMRTKLGVYTLNFDDLYNNIKVFEYDIKGSTGSYSNIQNVAFVSSDNTSSTNEVHTAFGVDEFDLEEMDLKWQVAMISTRLKKFYKKTGKNLNFDAKEHVGFDKSKVECFNCHNTGHFAKECRSKGNQDSRRTYVGNTGYKARDNDETDEYALMAFNSSNSGSDTEMSAKDKSRLGYGSQIHDGVLSYENDVFASVFDSRSSDVEDSHVNDRFAKVKGMHAVPPPMTRNYIDLDSCESSSSEETLETMPKPVESKPKVVNEPQVWTDAPIFEEYELDSDDENYSLKRT
nr:hypothetical protein [Tanacetum cinerariifolium]